jgi:multiple sugar transport system substrate-binding protein
VEPTAWKIPIVSAKATGVKVTISRESIDDVQPKASVAANTGAGPDLIWGEYALPHLFANKCVDVTDVADYLGKKYGGWVWPPMERAAATNGLISLSASLESR